MIPTRTVKFRVTREEEWFPEFDVPADFTDEQAAYISSNRRSPTRCMTST